MALNDSLAERKTNSSSRILFFGVKPLEKLEQTIKILGVYSNAVILHRKQILCFLMMLSRHMDTRRFFCMKFNCVTYQILKNLNKLSFVRHDLWKLIVGHHRAIFFN